MGPVGTEEADCEGCAAELEVDVGKGRVGGRDMVCEATEGGGVGLALTCVGGTALGPHSKIEGKRKRTSTGGSTQCLRRFDNTALYL